MIKQFCHPLAVVAFLSFASGAAAREPTAAVPMGSPGWWATSGDYPREALQKKLEGTAGFRVTVGPDGKPSACEIVASSGVAAFDEVTCSVVMTRAKFYPARDAKGKVTEGVYSNAIRWILPPDVSKTLSPKSETLTFILDKDGSIKDCTFVVTGADAEVARKTKNLCDSHSAFNEPYRDADGKAVAKRVIMKSSLELEDVAK